jgi:hypothetical protein
MSEYEDARARVVAFLDALGWGDGHDGGIITQHGLHDLRFEDVALLAKVPEPPNVGVQPEVESLISAGTPSLDGQYAEIQVLKAFANDLQSRIERLEAGRRMNDLPRVSFVHDAGCPAGGNRPPIERGHVCAVNDAMTCTCKVGP